jgi:hypothetical protein
LAKIESGRRSLGNYSDTLIAIAVRATEIRNCNPDMLKKNGARPEIRLAPFLGFTALKKAFC